MQVNNSVNMADSSWRLGTSSHVLMRASQISSELSSGSPSYLRLSLGEFFQQRSEALGCLGSEEDEVKRVCSTFIEGLNNETETPAVLVWEVSWLNWTTLVASLH